MLHKLRFVYSRFSTVNYTYRVNLLMGGFFLISLCLGVSGTFWMQTRNRREEVGIMKSFGARSVYIIRMLLGEGIVLSTLATLTGCLIYLQYAYTDHNQQDNPYNQ